MNSGNISFNNLTIQNGSLANNNESGISILNSAVAAFTATINNALIQNNNVTGAAGWLTGSAVVSAGSSAVHAVTLNINNSTFYNNQITNSEGSCSALSYGNSSGDSFVSGTVANTSFISNTANNASGLGCTVLFWGSGLTIQDSLFYNNTTNGSAGVLSVETGLAAVPVLINDTFDSNSATGGGSGGVVQIGGAGAVNATNCTFANNSGTGAGVLEAAATGGNLANNIFYNNGAQICNGSPMTSLGGNLSDKAAADCTLTQGTDIVSTNAQLDALANNGGPTQTMALSVTSPALYNAVTTKLPPNRSEGLQPPPSYKL